jgi:hypothetical protein
MKKEIVIASYNESLDWVKDIPMGWDTTIYRATDGLTEEKPDEVNDLPVIRIPNGGREAGQYLWHIINRRNELADITLFVQGDFLKHGKLSDIQGIDPNDPRPMAYLGVALAHDKPWPHELGPMHEELHAFVWDKKPPQSGSFSVGAQLWARKNLIESVPESIYMRYYDKKNTGHFAHLLEGTWHTVFGVYHDKD